MKKGVLIFAIAAVAIISCNNADQQSGSKLTQEQKDKARSDSANFTTIQWLDSSYTDLGKIKEGQVVEVSYRFKNAGNKNLIIADVKAACGCTVPEKPEQPIAPGEEGVIKAKFDSKGRMGEQRKEIYVTANTNPEVMSTLQFRVEITN
jgi:hypothetical protein